MFKAWKYVRWGTLGVVLLIEAVVFWFAHPGNDILSKLASARSWTWLGLTSLTLTWAIFELSIHSFRNGKRIQSELDDEGGEEITYESGSHWLVLRKNIRDHRIAWYWIWIPVWIASGTALFFTGWAAWLTATFPDTLTAWSVSARASVNAHLNHLIALPVDWILAAVPGALEYFSSFVRSDPLSAFGALTAAWLVCASAERIMRRLPAARLFMRIAHLSAWAVVLVAIFGLAALWLNGLVPIYTFLPHNGPVAMGFFPLTFSIPFFVPHIAEWLSKRYALITDKQSLDAALLICEGIFDYDKERISLERVVDTHIHQAWWQRIFGVGDITLIETGGHDGKVIPAIWGPRQLDRAIEKAIRRRRRHQSGTTD